MMDDERGPRLNRHDYERHLAQMRTAALAAVEPGAAVRRALTAGDVAAARSQSPNEEAIYSAGPQPSSAQKGMGVRAIRARPRGEKPFQLGGAEVRVQTETGTISD